MHNKTVDPNAKKALTEFKLEIASEFDDFSARNEVFPIGGIVTKNFIDMAEKEFGDKNNK